MSDDYYDTIPNDDLGIKERIEQTKKHYDTVKTLFFSNNATEKYEKFLASHHKKDLEKEYEAQRNLEKGILPLQNIFEGYREANCEYESVLDKFMNESADMYDGALGAQLAQANKKLGYFKKILFPVVTTAQPAIAIAETTSLFLGGEVGGQISNGLTGERMMSDMLQKAVIIAIIGLTLLLTRR